MNQFPSLTSKDLEPVLEAVRARLERYGENWRGRMRLPDGVTPRGRAILGTLVDRPVSRWVDLEMVERKLAELGVGADLPSALEGLGYPVAEEPARRRAVRRRSGQARRAARAEVSSWDLPWGHEWIESVVRSGILAGLGVEEAVGLVKAAREVVVRAVAATDVPGGPSRVDLAAELLGDSHALDWGTRHSRAVTRAFSVLFGGEGRDAWERAGVNLDRVSAPVLIWGLTSLGHRGLGPLLAETLALEVPAHLSLLAVRRYPVVVREGLDVLVTENPRMVEAASERKTPFPVVALNGNPSSAARLLIDQLLHCGARLRYHGDFDSAGLQICGRMHRLSLRPWRMDSGDYLDALQTAESQGARLPIDTRRAPPTPWDPELQRVFDERRCVVHEERLINSLLDE